MKYKIMLLCILIFSCGSDNLDNSKAADIISDCLDDNPIQRTAVLKINKAQITKDDIEKYKTLADEGVIEMEEVEQEKIAESNSNSNDTLAQWRRDRYTEFNINLTKKGKA